MNGSTSTLAASGRCLDWLLTFGKDPRKAEGYATSTVENRASRMDQFYRWVWEQEDGYTSNLTHDHGDGYLRHLGRRECSNAHKNACRKAVMMLYKWRHHQRGESRGNQSCPSSESKPGQRSSVFGFSRFSWDLVVVGQAENGRERVRGTGFEPADPYGTAS